MNSERRLLIVDDEMYIRQSFTDFFEDQEWNVTAVDSGEAGLELLETQAFDAAVVDIRMGGMDGESFIRAAAPKYPGMRFLICTGSPEYMPSDEIIKLPSVAEQVFAKPVTDLAQLETALLKLLGQE